jgi:hypothetical protein
VEKPLSIAESESPGRTPSIRPAILGTPSRKTTTEAQQNADTEENEPKPLPAYLVGVLDVLGLDGGRDELHKLVSLVGILDNEGHKLARGAGLELEALSAALDGHTLGALGIDNRKELLDIVDLLGLHSVRGRRIVREGERRGKGNSEK